MALFGQNRIKNVAFFVLKWAILEHKLRYHKINQLSKFIHGPATKMRPGPDAVDTVVRGG